MRYAEAVRFLYALQPRGVQLGLSRVELALSLRSHPERAVPAVLVAGTNGKGSVAAVLASVLRAAGYRTGLYTSPHLHRVTERFRIDDRPVGPRDFARRVSHLAPFLSDPHTPQLTFFEACTLLAFEIFRDARCDVSVLEVGLGGRLDATNVVTPVVSVISGIARDHEDMLGHTPAAIAREKAGIIKRDVPVVVGACDSSALRVITARARRQGAALLRVGREVRVSGAARACDVLVQGRPYADLSLPLPGAHQRGNLACAVAALDVLGRRGFSIPERALRRGLARTRWPARLELIPGAPQVLLDAAHNPQACQSLAAYLTAFGSTAGKRMLVFGVMRDKDHAAMLDLLAPVVDGVVFSTPDTPRAQPARALCDAYGGLAVDSPRHALARARKLAGKRGLVIVAGSIFLVAPIRAQLLGLASDAAIAL